MIVYLKPLRRKFGVVTLALACLFTAGWVRSCFIGDDCGIRTGKSRMEWFGSCDQYLLWGHIQSENDETRRWYYSFRATKFGDPPADFQWRWHCGDFGFAESSNLGAKFLLFPYWSIVVPLTLLSAWLLLSKPRPPKPCSKLSK